MVSGSSHLPVSLKGKIINLSGNKAIADTGTTLVLVSDEVCEALYNAIPEARYSPTQQGYVFPRSTKVEDLPEFKVAIGDKQFVIQPQDLVFALADKDNWYGGLQSRGNLPFDIFGDAFLKSVYAVCRLEAEISRSMLMKDRFGTKAANDLESFQKLKKLRIWTLRLSHRRVHSLLYQEGFVSMGGA